MVVIETIDAYLATLPYANINNYGLAEIHSNGEDNYPAVYQDKQWNQISPTDLEEFMSFHLLVSTENAEDENSFGLTFTLVHTVDLIILVEREVYDPDELIGQLKGIPTSTTSGGWVMMLENINHNHDEVISEIWPTLDYTKHKTDFKAIRLTYNATKLC